MADKVYFGVPGNIQEIPAPLSGMGFESNVDTEVTDLVSGGRSVYRAPTAYKTFNMTWRKSSAALKHIIDLYNGQFGPGPFYITDPSVDQENVLPARWSNAWQLGHQANGWCRPVVTWTTGTPTNPATATYFTNRSVTFTQATAGASVLTEKVVRVRTIRVPGKPYYLAVVGTNTGGAGIRVRKFDNSSMTWVTGFTYTNLIGAPVEVVAATDTTTTMIELDVYMPLGSTMTLQGISLGTILTRSTPWFPVGHGVGAIQFGDTTGSELVSSTIDRIGLSLDFIEVESVEG
jgi:hypothetical protein